MITFSQYVGFHKEAITDQYTDGEMPEPDTIQLACCPYNNMVRDTTQSLQERSGDLLQERSGRCSDQ